MRRFTIGLVAVILAGFGFDAMASADQDGGDLVFTEKVTKFTELDLGATGVGEGDRFTYQSELLDGDGKLVGTGGGECTSIAPKDGGLGLTNCLCYLALADGELMTAGLYDLTQPSGALAVIGGTGRYAGAGGTAAYTVISDDTFGYEVRLTG